MIVSVGDLATDLVVRLGTDEIDPVSDTPAEVTLHRGGAAANVAAVSARLGRSARFVGALGTDQLSRTAAEALTAVGVDVCGPPARRGWSIVVLVDPDGARRFLTDVGDGDPWPVPDSSWLDGAARLHFSGYALCNDRSVEACRALSAMAAARSVPRSVDVCSASVVRTWGVERFVDLVDEIGPDVIKANTDEASLLGDNWARQSRHVVTAGASETSVIDPVAGEVTRYPVASRTVVDTTGAGDAFTAGFLLAWDESRDVDVAVLAGHRAAGRVVGGVGADAWEDDPDD